ncbi:unnamed protein product [Didymodactylos carnosus]|nr:unnamed protein product [Didymodactylos carnosus]CAF3938837.1 unnamed protein product [Didymodactylos carnosus]
MEEKKHAEYDFIVVGSGPGGGIVASRLALRGFKVLVIEAGPDYNTTNATIPFFAPLAENDPIIGWDFEPYTYNTSINQTILYPRASTVGGCSRHNTLIAFAPNPFDWDDIGQITGDESWNYKNMKKYWKLVENYEYDTAYANVSQDKFNGWLDVTQNIERLPGLKTNPVLASLITTINDQLKFTPDVSRNNNADSWFYLPQSVSQTTGSRQDAYVRLKQVQKTKYGSNLLSISK